MTPSRGTDQAPGLRNAREAERTATYLRTIWQRRHYTWYVAKSDLRSRQIDSVLGNLWHLLNPLLQISVYFLFFGLILDTRRGTGNFLAYLSIGVFMYTYTQRSVLTGGRSLFKYRGLIQMVSFPRATIPLTTTLIEALAVLPSIGVMFGVALVTGETPALTWLLVVPLFVVQTLLNAGLSLIVARAASHLPDVQDMLPFVFRLGFYASGVLFNVSAYLEGNQYRFLFEMNPLYCFLELNRGFILEGSPIEWRLATIVGIWTVAATLFGFVWFRRAEDSYGDR